MGELFGNVGPHEIAGWKRREASWILSNRQLQAGSSLQANMLRGNKYISAHRTLFRGGTTWTGDHIRKGGKNWTLPKEMNANRFLRGSHWLEIWKNHLYSSMGPNGWLVWTQGFSKPRNLAVVRIQPRSTGEDGCNSPDLIHSLLSAGSSSCLGH